MNGRIARIVKVQQEIRLQVYIFTQCEEIKIYSITTTRSRNGDISFKDSILTANFFFVSSLYPSAGMTQKDGRRERKSPSRFKTNEERNSKNAWRCREVRRPDL